MPRAIMWFRRDLRLEDNPAWALATRHDEVVPLFVLDRHLLDAAGPYRRRQLLASAEALDRSLADQGGRLHVRIGDPTDIVPEVVGNDALYYNADTTRYAQSRDASISDTVANVTSAWGTLFHPPGSVLTQKGTLSQVFTPFYRRWSAIDPDPWPQAGALPAIASDPGQPLPDLDDEPPMPAGEDAAHQRLADWLDRVDDYPDARNLPAIDGTSQLSADLHFGTLSPRRVAEVVGESSGGREAFVRQLSWRDWYAHLALDNRDLATRSVRPAYDRIRWQDGRGADVEFEVWRDGRTGYPIVDAGMRQLATTGWMHNRVRMIVASFLVKDLLIDWRRGEQYFRRMLVDGDYSQNAGNWQWVAGTGPDAAPYFRIFNPISQSKKFDSRGDYIRHFVPELAKLDAKMIHAPWEAGPLDLAEHGVVLGDTYPHPIVDHAEARERTLSAYKAAKGG